MPTDSRENTHTKNNERLDEELKLKIITKFIWFVGQRQPEVNGKNGSIQLIKKTLAYNMQSQANAIHQLYNGIEIAVVAFSSSLSLL